MRKITVTEWEENTFRITILLFLFAFALMLGIELEIIADTDIPEAASGVFRVE